MKIIFVVLFLLGLSFSSLDFRLDDAPEPQSPPASPAQSPQGGCALNPGAA